MNYTTPQVVAEIHRQITSNYNGENTAEIVTDVLEIIARNYLNLDDVPSNFVTLTSSGQNVFAQTTSPLKAVGVDGDIYLYVEAATALLRIYNKVNGNWILCGVPIGGNVVAGTTTIFTASYSTTAADYQAKCGGGTGVSVVRSASSTVSLADAEDQARLRALDAIVCSMPPSGVYTGTYTTTPADYQTVCGYAGSQQITKTAYSTTSQIDANAKAKAAAIAAIVCTTPQYTATYTTTAADYQAKCGVAGAATITKSGVSSISQADAYQKAQAAAIAAIACNVPAGVKATPPSFGAIDDINNIVTLTSNYPYTEVRWGVETQSAQPLASNSICSPGNIAGRLFAYVIANSALNRTQSDTVFSAPFSVSATANNAPTASISIVGGVNTVAVGQSVTLNLSGSDTDGSVVKVEALDNGVKIGEITGASGLLQTVGLSVGVHNFTARSVDDKNATGISAVAIVNAQASSNSSAAYASEDYFSQDYNTY